ncbi:MAG: thrombospondin type 3 repeat-containing protein [Deltaproteobacteria bacterium]|nr:thrombospondin type 3 repeat-containing protein [Deltaproteobacteria bacterium]
MSVRRRPRCVQWVIATLAVVSLGLWSTTLSAATCYVTNDGGDLEKNTILYHLANQSGMPDAVGTPCTTIQVSVSSVKPLVKTAAILAGTTIKGNGVTLKLAAGAQNKGCVVDIKHGDTTAAGAGNSTLENVAISAVGVHGLCVYSDDNTIKDVTVSGTTSSGSLRGIGDYGNKTQMTASTVKGVSDGLYVTGDGGNYIDLTLKENDLGAYLLGDKSRLGGSTIEQNRIGVLVSGFDNLIGIAVVGGGSKYIANTIKTNSETGVTVSGTNGGKRNRITRNPIYNNTSKGIALISDGNENFPAPKTLRSIYVAGGGTWGFAGLVDEKAGNVEYFVSDSGQGKNYKGFITQFSNAYTPGTKKLFYTLFNTSAMPLTQPVVTTATQSSTGLSANTSPFSNPLTPNADPIDGFPEPCLTAGSWFLGELERAMETGEDPWDLECEEQKGGKPDKQSNDEEDPNHNCTVDPGETDPCTFDGEPGVCIDPAVCPEDTDGDGIPNKNDNCPYKYNPDQNDGDQDGIGDVCDNCATIGNPDQSDLNVDGVGDLCEDLDGDGDLNLDDNCPYHPNPGQEDFDQDGAGDLCDPDDDNDGLLDDDESVAGTEPLNPDTDADGICDGSGWGFGATGMAFRCEAPDDNCPLKGNVTQQDTDEDGIGDLCDAVPTLYRGPVDSDGDGKADSDDTCPMIKDNGTDTDGDGMSDPCDPDDDNDGLNDWAEPGAYRWVPPAYTKTPSATGGLDPKKPDSDNDGLCDGAGTKAGVCAGFDNCPDYYATNVGLGLDGSIAQHADATGNGIGDLCENAGGPTDTDADGIPDAQDNCPLTPNVAQVNTDGDSYNYTSSALYPTTKVNTGGGDACDPDDDDDGMFDWDEGLWVQLHIWEPDSDHYNGKGYDDYCDGSGIGFGSGSATQCNASDNCPIRYNPDQKDVNGNGIGDLCEDLGFGDQDGDGISDGGDNCPGTANPDQLDTDGDGIGNECDPDDDNDGIIDSFDNCPLIPNPDQLDTDTDGIGNVCDSGPGGGGGPGGGSGPVPSTSIFPGNGPLSFEMQGTGVARGCSLIPLAIE